VYFIAAEIQGAGMDSADEIALWASNSLEPGQGLIYAVDALANEFSEWPDGRKTGAAFSTRDDGAKEAIQCVKDTFK